LEQDIGEYRKNISDHKVQLQQLLRDVEKVKSEAADTVADVITSKQEKELAETLAGIAQDGTAEELQGLRDMRQELKAEAKVTRELAGTDTKAQEAEFLEYARQSQSSSEFDALIGLASETEDKSKSTGTTDKKDTALPE
jgi:phage shock protein A